MTGQEAVGEERTVLLGAAVTLLALAGICALLGGHLLLGVLRLAAGLLAGAGLGAAVAALLRGRVRRRTGHLLAGAGALVLALALTVPAVLATRLPALAPEDAVSVDALGEGDVVHSLPAEGAPVLVRRADGSAQLLDAAGVREVEASAHDVLALSADGTRLVRATGASTEVLALDRSLSTPDGGLPSTRFEGSPLALDGDLLVLRRCQEGFCEIAGYDLTDPERPLWVASGSAETRGVDPAGVAVPARPAEPPGLLDAAREAGALPAVPLRFDPAEGWVQLDAATGFPVGRILAGPAQECRIAATESPVTGRDPREEGTVVLTVCSAEDGALTATALRDGAVLWESAPSPAGEWTVRLDQGRVLASGTEAGTDVTGEIVASADGAEWTVPGGEGIAQAAEFTARLGIDGAQMVVTNASGQLLAYDTADGTHTWTLPLSAPDAAVRGGLAAGTAVAVDPVARERPLDPREGRRLRILDAATGEVALERRTAQRIEAVHPVGGGRALVTVGERSVLLGG